MYGAIRFRFETAAFSIYINDLPKIVISYKLTLFAAHRSIIKNASRHDFQ